MAHVLILTLVFPPDGVSTAVIMGDLAADFVAAGHSVSVVTTVPHYNRDAVAEQRQPLRRTRVPFVFRSELYGVRSFHISMPRKGPRVLGRLVAWLQFHLLSLLIAPWYVRDVDIIIAPSPPLTIGVAAWALGKIYRAPFVYIVQEIYPDIAIRVGALKNGTIIRLLRAVEKFVYARAALITVIADGMRINLLKKAIEPDKVRVVPNFVDVGIMMPMPKDNQFARRYDLVDKFVVTYAGNMGPAQGMETVVEAATLLRDVPDLEVLLIGEGSLRDKMEQLAAARGLRNIRVMAHQPYALVPQIYAASDICLVLLAPNAGSDAVPSKVYRIMACARPVLACTERESDLAALVERAASGFVTEPGSPQGLADAILLAKRDLDGLKAMGVAGKEYVLAHYTRSVVVKQYDAIVYEVVARARKRKPRQRPLESV